MLLLGIKEEGESEEEVPPVSRAKAVLREGSATVIAEVLQWTDHGLVATTTGRAQGL